MDQRQILKNGIWELTDLGKAAIIAGKNDFTEATRPISYAERDWKLWDISNLWIGIIVSIAVYQVASGLLVAGMNWWQALITIVLGHTIVMGVAMVIGHFGTRYGLTYPLLSKLIFGRKGMVFPVIVRGILGVFWFGVQAWIGGQAVNIIISAIYPAWQDGGFTTLFISFLIFWCMNVYIAASGSKAVKILEGISAPVLIVLSLVVIVWGMDVANWNLDTLLSAKVVQSGQGIDFWTLFWPALSAMIAFDGGIALSITDFTRHCVNQKSQIWGQIISAPIMTGYIAFVGICGTAGGYLAFGKEIWEPAVLVGNFESLWVRLVFSAFIIMAVLTTNVAGNLIPPTNIIAAVARGKVGYKMASFIAAVLALFARPWDSLSSAYHLIFEITQLLGALLGPLSGIFVVAYICEHMKYVEYVDLFRIEGGRYSYSRGWNVRAVSIFLLITAIIFISRIVPSIEFIFNNAYVYGTIASGLLYYIAIKIK